jgi:hypothetical protein
MEIKKLKMKEIKKVKIKMKIKKLKIKMKIKNLKINIKILLN